jgi:hypothetical protein
MTPAAGNLFKPRPRSATGPVDTLHHLAGDVVILRALIHDAFFRQTAADDIMVEACAIVLQDRRDRIEELVRDAQRA